MSVVSPMLQHNEKEWSTDRGVTYEDHSRKKSAILWATVAILTIALGVLVYYGYRTAKTQNFEITQIFGNQGTLTTLAQRADAAETKMHDLAAGWQGIGERLTKLENRVVVDGKQTRIYAQSLMQQLHQQLIAEMDARTSALDARVRQVESDQANQRAQLAAVEANLQQDISSVRDENSRDLSGVRQDVSGVRQEEGANEHDISALSQKLDRQRIDFEMSKGQTKELLPGISLQIQGMNPKYQRYHGSLWLLQDRRTVWLRDQSVHESVRFFHKDGEETNDPYELVVTDVTKKAVVGYLLAPVKPEDSSAELSR
jgi:hypothetical protein